MVDVKRLAKGFWVISLVVLLLGGLVLPAAAQSGGVVTAEVDRTSLSTDEVLLLTVTVDLATDAGQPSLPALDGFDLLSSSNSAQFHLGNGGMQAQAIYQYQLRPTRPGTLTIGPIEVEVGGQRYQTDPITVQVSQGTGNLVQPVPQPALPGFPSLPNFPSFPNLLGGGGAATGNLPVFPAAPPAGLQGQDFYVTAEIDQATPYQGQQVVYTFRFFQASELFDQPEYQAPDFTGLWHEQQPEQAEYVLEVAGRSYRVTELQTVLFPTVVGELTIDPAGLLIPGGFFSNDQELHTQPVSLTVRPLPDPAPAGFQGAVGQFSLEAAVDPLQTVVNDTVTWHVAISGRGNIGNLPDPAWPEGPEWRAFDSPASVETTFADGLLQGTRRYERVLVPTQAGSLTLPPLTYVYFDPLLGSYQTLQSGPTVVAVAPDGQSTAPRLPTLPAGSGGQPPAGDGAEVAGLQPLKPVQDTWQSSRAPLPFQAGYWLLWTIPLALLVGQWGWQWQQKRRAGRAEQRQQAQAAAVARQALRQSGPGSAPAGQILLDYLAMRLSRPVVGLTRYALAGLLRDKGVPDELVHQTMDCLAQSDATRFAPAAAPNAGLLAETEQLITALDPFLS